MTNILLTETKVEWHLYCCQDYTGVKNTPLRSYSGVTNTMLIEAIIEWQIHWWLKLQRRDKYTVERSYSRMTNTLLARQGLYRQVWVKFKDYSRTSKSLSVFENSRIQGLFKAFEWFSSTFQGRFNFKDFSRKPSKFKYFSSLCEPCKTILE